MRVARDIGILLASKAAVGALVLAGGFRAVSDDDFARVVLAQQWAAAPRVDPTGTSWLPAPFWIYGTVMRWASPSLEVARATAFVLGLASALLLYLAARLLLRDERAALWGALIAAVLPWSARLGVATVPELPTAALTVFAVATLASDRRAYRLWGAAALTLACLSRYEPWLVAPLFVGLTLWDLRSAERASRPGWLLAASLALVGPLMWLIHNAVSHGDAFHFLARVSAYKKAVGGVPASLVALVEGYPLSLLREEPEICILAAAALLVARVRRLKLPASLPRTAAVLGVVLLLLTIASLPGGAPTHHAGRALLTLWLVAALYVGAAARAAYADPGKLKWAFSLLLLVVLPVGGLVLRPWYARLDSFTPRFEETAIGAAAGEALRAQAVAGPDGARGGGVLLEVEDYRFFAVQAASGMPGAFHLDRDIDPRTPAAASSFASIAALERKIAVLQPTLVIAELAPVPRLLLGEPAAAVGSWGLWRVPDELRYREATAKASPTTTSSPLNGP